MKDISINNSKFEMSEISIHKTELMGACVIGILACHLLLVTNQGGIYRGVLLLGNCGVQGFMFLSGMGIHRSLQYRKDPIIHWYGRRILRVMIPYLFVAVPYWVFWAMLHSAGFIECVKGIIFIRYWTAHDGFWFIAAIIPMYLLAPAYKKIYDLVPLKFGITLLMTLLFILIGFHTNEITETESIIWNIQWCMEKTAPFFLGYYFWDLLSIKKFINHWMYSSCTVILFVVLSVLPIVGRISWWWILVFPAFVIICIVINHFGYYFSKPLRFLGEVSLESYMLNVAFIELFIDIRRRTRFLAGDKVAIIVYAFIIIGGILLSIPYSKMTKRMLESVSTVDSKTKQFNEHSVRMF